MPQFASSSRRGWSPATTSSSGQELGWFSFVLCASGDAISPVNDRPDRRAALDAVMAVVLNVDPAVDLVARRQACQVSRPTCSSTCRRRPPAPSSAVGIVGPFRGVAGVRVGEHVGFRWRFPGGGTSRRTTGLITDDRAAERRVDVPQLVEFGRCQASAICASLRLSLWNELLAMLKNMLPLKMFAPCLLTMFSCGPPVTASASRAAQRTLTSCALPISGSSRTRPCPGSRRSVHSPGPVPRSGARRGSGTR